jgi:hypothetical protein
MSRFAFTIAGAVALALSLSACDAVTDKASTPETAAPTPGAPPTEPAATPLAASGAAQPLTAEDAGDESLQSAASVVRVDWVGDNQAKLFGTAGGDPAMNGLYAYIGFYVSPAEPWAIYRLGDILDYTVLSSSPGRADLEIHESTMNDATGEIGERRRRVIVQWTMGSDEGPPTSVTVTPAQ